MRAVLRQWTNGADVVRYQHDFAVEELFIDGPFRLERVDDYYISLVGELFSDLKEEPEDPSDWSRLGNALLLFATPSLGVNPADLGISTEQAALFAATAFYVGGFPASAYLAAQLASPTADSGVVAACFEFLTRPAKLRSPAALRLLSAVRLGKLADVSTQLAESADAADAALAEGAAPWILATLLHHLLKRFSEANLRAVLPDGWDARWDKLVRSLIDRSPPTWEFFPSQIEAIRRGLLVSTDSFALQMPTGAGKTTLCETLLYSHLSGHPGDAAVLLVPFRSLASELRNSLVKRLNGTGIPARCAYGGSVPSSDEAQGLDQVRAMVATPESISGILSADPVFSQRISLVICDEGHLLDSPSRGVGLELLLARMKSSSHSPRFVFVSAIVPNIEEINSWLGGDESGVVRSTYHPTATEYAVLRTSGSGAGTRVDLVVHPEASAEEQVRIPRFLSRSDFRFRNLETGREKTFAFGSNKARAVAAARKLLPLGPVAIFAANKRGNQGAVGIAEELLKQLQHPLSLPVPGDSANKRALEPYVEYVAGEYGDVWIGTSALRSGAVLHHGDIPQETREALERLVRDKVVHLVICTATLAEGVNLPIRSLVLYSVQRRTLQGPPEDMLARDIKNLVGRAGRAGVTTKGLVICANSKQWSLVEPVAMQGAGEPVYGSLQALVARLSRELIRQHAAISNELLESLYDVYPLTDGVDATLVELISEEVGSEEFVSRAQQLADQTLAVRRLTPDDVGLLRRVFELRARRVVGLRTDGKLGWVRGTGAHIRLMDSVERTLIGARADWSAPVDPMDGELRSALLGWAWTDEELRRDVVETLRPDGGDADLAKGKFFEVVRLWMAGARFVDIARQVSVEMDNLLAAYTRAVSFTLHTLVAQGVALLAGRLKADGIEIAAGAVEFVERLRFGAPTHPALVLAASGIRHRLAYVELGKVIAAAADNEVDAVLGRSRAELEHAAATWQLRLGKLVYDDTLADVSSRDATEVPPL